MSTAPSYSDLGKDASDLFNKGYDFDAVKIDIKPKVSGTNSDVKLSLTSKVLGNILSPASANPSTSGLIEMKNKCNSCGISTTSIVRQNSQISTELTKEFLENRAKVTGEVKFTPPTGAVALKSKGSYKNQNLNGSIQIEKDHAKPLSLIGNLVLGYSGLLIGSQICCTTQMPQAPYPDVSLGYQSKAYTLNALYSNNRCMTISTHQRIDRNLELAFQGLFDRNNALHPRFNVAAKYTNSNTIYRMKVNSQKFVGLSYARLLQPGVKITLSSFIDFGNFAGGNHRLGVAFDFD